MGSVRPTQGRILAVAQVCLLSAPRQTTDDRTGQWRQSIFQYSQYTESSGQVDEDVCYT